MRLLLFALPLILTCCLDATDWTADIPAAAYGPGQHYMVVTAPSPMHHYLMKVRHKGRQEGMGGGGVQREVDVSCWSCHAERLGPGSC